MFVETWESFCKIVECSVPLCSFAGAQAECQQCHRSFGVQTLENVVNDFCTLVTV